MNDIIDFHTKTTFLTEEGDSLRESDVIFPNTIKAIPWDFGYPTMVYKNVGDQYADVQSVDIVSKLFELYPILLSINLDNVMIAGGSIGTILQKLAKGEVVELEAHQDIDLFLYGLTKEKAFAKAVALISQIKACNSKFNFIRTECAFSLITEKQKIQIVLKIYETPSQIIHGFDLGSAMIGIYKHFRKFRLITCKLGLYSLEHRINTVTTKNCSTTYELRLHKYLRRGFKIVLPNLNMAKIIKQQDNPTFHEYIITFNRIIVGGDGKSEVNNNSLTVNWMDKHHSSEDYDVNDYSDLSYFDDETCAHRFKQRYYSGEYFQYSSFVPYKEFTNGQQAITNSLLVKELSPSLFNGFVSNLKPPKKRGLGSTLEELWYQYQDCKGITLEKIYMDHFKTQQEIDRIEKLVSKPNALAQLYNEGYRKFCVINWKEDNLETCLSGCFRRIILSDEAWYGKFYKNNV